MRNSHFRIKKMDTKKKTLLQKYNIPISHLDFDYVQNCTNAREMEKIVSILRSGEEGYFPDLTKCAEATLVALKPNSRILRQEEPILTKGSEEWNSEKKNVQEWSGEVKKADAFFASMTDAIKEELQDSYPAVRKPTKINPFSEKSDKDKNCKSEVKKVEAVDSGKSTERIKSTDYSKWDKYDPETEILKMELDEERVKEQVENKNRINAEKSKKLNGYQEEGSVSEVKSEFVAKLTQMEKEQIAVSFKNRGNEYFRTKEFKNAVIEYTKCINIFPTPAGYNNRALANLKLMNYKLCLEDVERCLQSEPNNVKALLRKAQALLGIDKRREAYSVYKRVKELDAANSIAVAAIKDLEQELPDLKCIGGTRIQIVEEHTPTEPKTTKLAKQDKAMRKPPSSPRHKIDPALLIVPKKIVKNKFLSAMQNLGKMEGTAQKKCENRNNTTNNHQFSEGNGIKIFEDLGHGEIVKRETRGESGCIIQEL